jgi:hypothetical protein
MSELMFIKLGLASGTLSEQEAEKLLTALEYSEKQYA